MITKSQHYGGFQRRVTTVSTQTLTPLSPVVQHFVINSVPNITVLGAFGTDFPKNENGSLRFVVYNDITSNRNLSLGGKTIRAGDKAYCYQLTTSTFIVRIVTTRTSTSSTRAAITSQTTPPEYEPYCFDGDLCDLAVAAGLAPLNGEGGRSLVVVPMWEDVTEWALNASREPIRGADFVAPSHIPILFVKDTFAPDPLHARSSVVLPVAFYEAMTRAHVLPYSNAAHGTSRHWLHAYWQVVSLSWTQTQPSIKRHVWKLNVDYEGGQFEVRCQLEHSINPEPALATGGGASAANAAWGAVFTVSVFNTALLPAFVDGDTHQPYLAAAPIVFTRDNPCVYDPSQPGLKFCHPHLVTQACVVTTFQSPMTRAWVPLEDKKYVKTFKGSYDTRGRNREKCYDQRNALPWTTGACVALGGDGRMGCSVFGDQNGFAMTLGGGYPKSKPLEYLCFENGQGLGRTYLRPLLPGWDEACGLLDVASGSGGSIRFCIDGSSYDFDACVGHPDELMGARGGTHQCFNTLGGKCCIKPKAAQAEAFDVCTRSATTFGPFNGTPCTIALIECQQIGTFWKSVLLELDDYDYNLGSNPEQRVMSWVRLLPDPTHVPKDYVYNASAVADIVQAIGSWTLGATIVASTVAGSGLVRAALTFAPTTYTMRDQDMVATGTNCLGHSHGLGSRYAAGAFVGIIVAPTGGTNATVKLKAYDGIGGETVLATATITDNADIGVFTFNPWGAELTASYTPTGGALVTLSVNRCSNPVGFPVLFTESTTNGAAWSSWSIDELTPIFLEVVATAGYFAAGLTFPLALHGVYGNCTGTTNPDCGTTPPPVCNCTTEINTSHSDTQAIFGAARDIIPGCAGDNPTMPGGGLPNCLCDGQWCNNLTWYCGVCPEPFVSLSLTFPYRCTVDDPNEALYCAGLDLWKWVDITCE